ncbi:MAG: LPS export ABC transporter periplasmic protein LptC [Deltaproteobacteria bacterium]|nr:LPS export ABC transporter periplasmic protein LptC [Deltaproteobacteria bacterium]
MLGIGLLLIVVGFYLKGVPKKDMGEPVSAETGAQEGIRFEDIHYTQDNPDEGMKWTLDAREAIFSRDRRLISFRSFKLRLEPQDRAPIELEGESGSYDRDLQEIRVHGNLRGVTEDGYRIFAEHLRYDHRSGDFTTEDPVTITGPFFSLQGEGLHLNLGTETARIRAHVTAFIESRSLFL